MIQDRAALVAKIFSDYSRPCPNIMFDCCRLVVYMGNTNVYAIPVDVHICPGFVYGFFQRKPDIFFCLWFVVQYRHGEKYVHAVFFPFFDLFSVHQIFRKTDVKAVFEPLPDFFPVGAHGEYDIRRQDAFCLRVIWVVLKFLPQAQDVLELVIF